MPYLLTVNELIAKSHFPKATIVSGHQGLKHPVKWIHILETTNIEELLKGNELILTTGIQLKNEDDFLLFVKQLIKKQASALCVECCENIQSIPKSVQQLANEHNFPILVFNELIPFIEITQDIHSLIINDQYNQIKRLEDYAQEINKLTLKVNHFDQILMRLNKFLKVNVVFNVFDQQSLFIPNVGHDVYERLRKKLDRGDVTPYLIKCDVNLLEENYGEVCIFSEEREITEFDSLVLDRTVIALSQYLLRSLYSEEKQNMESRLFLESWLNGTHEPYELTAFLNEQDTNKLLSCRYLVMIERFQKSKKNYDLTYYKLYSRSIFEKSGFFLFLVETRQQLVYILADLTGQDIKPRMENCIDKMRIFKQSNNYAYLKMTTAIGQVVNDYHQISKSFETAKDTLLIRSSAKHLSYFYDDLYLYQIVLHMQKNRSIMDTAKNYLQVLFDYDAKHKSQLVETVQVYLQCNCMKQETAEKLFIARQTLYHRLNKIESLLGSDFHLPPKRLTLELMLFAMQNSFHEYEDSIL